jgi:hypothetical protein
MTSSHPPYHQSSSSSSVMEQRGEHTGQACEKGGRERSSHRDGLLKLLSKAPSLHCSRVSSLSSGHCSCLHVQQENVLLTISGTFPNPSHKLAETTSDSPYFLPSFAERQKTSKQARKPRLNLPSVCGDTVHTPGAIGNKARLQLHGPGDLRAL